MLIIEPPVSPSNIKVEKTDSGTKLGVSWDFMSPEDAWGFVVSYTVSYSKDNECKRQGMEKTIPGTQNSIIIEDVDPRNDYSVVVWASTKTGMGKQSEATLTKGRYIVIILCCLLSKLNDFLERYMTSSSVCCTTWGY